MPLVLISLLIVQAASAVRPYPPPEAFAAEVRRALAAGFKAQQEFTYLERRRDVDISLLGKVTVGPLRTFEVYPADASGDTYKRLIAVDGTPLDPAELARRDAEHARTLRRTLERRRRETARQRAAREEERAEERRRRDAMLDDAVAVYEPTFVGRDVVEGEPVWIVDIEPRPDPHVTTREGEWMRHFAGRIWVTEADHQIVRLEMRAFRDVTVGWGVIGRIHEGSHVRYRRQRVGDVWLPAELSYQATGRTLLVRPFELAVTTTYSDYRPLSRGERPRQSAPEGDRPAR